jgi:chromosome segregation ATPase
VVKEQTQEPASPGVGWVQDQLYQLKAQVAQLEQEMNQLQSAGTVLHETMLQMQTTLREAALGAAQINRLQEELNQAAALLVHFQDEQAEQRERLDALGRTRESEDSRDQQEWTEVARRTELLERQVVSWQDRQAGVDEVGRRFQEGLSLIRQQVQQIESRLEGTESKAARGLEGANRAEHKLTQVDAAIDELRREDETIAERARVNADVTHRLETALSEKLGEFQRLELLAERIELHRAERQRLEDRAARIEEEFGELRERFDTMEQRQSRMGGQQEGLGSRLDSLYEQVKELRGAVVDQIRKLIATQDRTKRRTIQELEREIRETKQYVADLTDQSV